MVPYLEKANILGLAVKYMKGSLKIIKEMVSEHKLWKMVLNLFDSLKMVNTMVKLKEYEITISIFGWFDPVL